ncbi:MAG: CRISPR-associated endoribonuclease Cas6 [Candidatus Margulisbacteria bacterium]|nr:CRISPR-associated endoribonuclease Cas6 [Candidatus Margulisiibacteriota bacterium]
MLSSLVVKLQPLESRTVLPYALGRELRAWFYNLLSFKSSSFSDKIHNMKGSKPFTVSLLDGKRVDRGGRMILDNKNLYRLRITGLTKEIFEVMSSSLFSVFSLNKTINFYDKQFLINKICISSEEHPLAGTINYEDLQDKRETKSFTLNFRTPSAFVYGDAVMALPVPYSVFRSYLFKWNSFSPSNFHMEEDLLKVIEKSLFPSRYSLNTKILDMDKFRMVGFTGKCTFSVMGKVSSEELKNILTLVRFSFYAGTGAKTTIGMGQTYPEFSAGQS